MVERLYKGVKDLSRMHSRLHIFRAANILIVLFILLGSVVLPFAKYSWKSQVLAAAVVAYVAYLAFHILDYFITKRFGREKEINGIRVIVETYNVRVLSLVTGVLVFVVGLIAIIRILGFDSLLEAGGVVGVLGVMLALTQGAWAPDIISGLVILNSKLIEEGDVIQLDESGIEHTGIVFKTKIFHTEILNLVNNHRIMLSNAKLRNMVIHNLSKFASAKGLREALHFNIGYDVKECNVVAMFEKAFELAIKDQDVVLESQHCLEIRAADAGDYAVRWTIFYYIKDVRRILNTRQRFLAIILNTARESGISLATPLLHQPDGSHGGVLSHSHNMSTGYWNSAPSEDTLDKNEGPKKGKHGSTEPSCST